MALHTNNITLILNVNTDIRFCNISSMYQCFAVVRKRFFQKSPKRIGCSILRYYDNWDSIRYSVQYTVATQRNKPHACKASIKAQVQSTPLNLKENTRKSCLVRVSGARISIELTFFFNFVVLGKCSNTVGCSPYPMRCRLVLVGEGHYTWKI